MAQAFDPFTAFFDLGKTAIEKIWPDADKRAEELRKLEELRQAGDLERLKLNVHLMVEQIKTNQVEAKHKSLFVAGARPAAIWAGVASLTWTGLFHPILTWVWAFAQFNGDPPPVIESAALTAIVTALLGVSTMRTVDKTKGNETNALGSR